MATTIVIAPKIGGAGGGPGSSDGTGIGFQLRADASPWLTTQATFLSGNLIELNEDPVGQTITVNTTLPANIVSLINGHTGNVSLIAGTGITLQDSPTGIVISADYGNVVRNVTVNGQLVSGGLSLTAGPGISLQTLPNSTIQISSTYGSGVQMVNGYTGQISIIAGPGISILNTGAPGGGTIQISGSGGSGVTSLNSLAGSLALAAGNGISISTNASTGIITISTTTGGGSSGGTGPGGDEPPTAPPCAYLVNNSNTQVAYSMGLSSSAYSGVDRGNLPNNTFQNPGTYSAIEQDDPPYCWLLPGRTYSAEFFTPYPLGNSTYGDLKLCLRFYSTYAVGNDANDYYARALLGQTGLATFHQDATTKASDTITFTTPNTYPKLVAAFASIESGLSPNQQNQFFCVLFTLLN